MKYLITQKGFEPFMTEWFDYENHYVSGMIVYNLLYYTYTKDGINWDSLEIDSL